MSREQQKSNRDRARRWSLINWLMYSTHIHYGLNHNRLMEMITGSNCCRSEWPCSPDRCVCSSASTSDRKRRTKHPKYCQLSDDSVADKPAVELQQRGEQCGTYQFTGPDALNHVGHCKAECDHCQFVWRRCWPSFLGSRPGYWYVSSFTRMCFGCLWGGPI